MTFRRKVGATFIFIIFIWILYNINIYLVITDGGREGEGIGRCLYINSSLLYCTFYCCLPGALAQPLSPNFYRITLEPSSPLSLWLCSVQKVHNTPTWNALISHVRIVSFSKLFFCSLHIFLVVGAIEPAQANDTLQLLEDVFKCNYSEPHSWGRKLLWFLRRSNYKQWVLHNDDLRAACEGKPSLCYDPHFVSSRCEEHPIRVIKTVRLRTRQVSQLLNNKGQTLHESTIYLIIVAGNCCRPQSQNYFAPQRPSRCEARLDWKSQQLFLIFLVLRSSRNKRRWCNFGGNFYLHNLIS